MRIVVKVGTSTLAHPSGLINIRRVEELCKVMSDLKANDLVTWPKSRQPPQSVNVS